MAQTTPWMTSNSLIESVKRKISFPISQTTFTEDDILAFASEEMNIGLVPDVLSYHEEYFVFSEDVPLETNKVRYQIPDRAIGMKLRDVFYVDSSGNLFEMARVAEDDAAFYQRNIGANQAIHKYYLQGNDIVLTQNNLDSPTGSLRLRYFLRPNFLVPDERAAIIDCFNKTLTIDNASLAVGDTVSIDGETFTAVSGSPGTNEFEIGLTSVATATNLTNTINTNGIATANNGSSSTAVINVCYNDIAIEITSSNDAGIAVQTSQGVQFESIPSNITNGSLVDFLQTKSGHRTWAMDVEIGPNAISNNVINFNEDDVPMQLVVGDYICLANECIIPQVPTDLHISLSERTCARILAAIGDQAGLAVTNQKLQEINQTQGNILNNRVEGSMPKVRARHGLLVQGKMYWRRRF